MTSGVAERDLRSETDETLLVEAADGSRAAAGEYLARHLRFLSAMSRKLGARVVDPDDLLADAVTRLLAKWADGSGPAENVNAYLITTMRNIVTDQLRSPRSRAVALDRDDELAAATDVGIRDAELHREFDWVRRALSQLPDDQQLVLTATVVQGRKPGDIATELGRSVGAVYTLSHRAKQALRRSLLQVMLDDDAPEECYRRSEGLNEPVGDTPETSTSRGSGLEHIRNCERCRRVWGLFAGISSTLGVATLLVIADTISPTPAMAATTTASTTHAATSQRGGSRRFVRQGQKVGATGLMILAGVAVALAGTGLIAVGALSAGTPGPQESKRGVAGAHSALATLTEHTIATSDGAILQLHFAVPEHHWSISSLNVTLPAGAELSAPQGWDCNGTTDVTCTTTTGDPTVGALTIHAAGALPKAAWSLKILAVVDDGTKVRASAWGGMPA